jgi:hypothetical protein
MTYTRNHARPLLTDAEYELFTASLSDHIGDLDAAGVRKAIGRLRKLRDKASDLNRRQAIAVRKSAGARGAAGTANERTAKKETVLSEALTRFEKRLDQLEAAEERAKRTKALDTKKRASAPAAKNRAGRRAASKGGAGEGKFMSGSAQAEATTAMRGPQTRINASRAAAGRRGQAKRDR